MVGVGHQGRERLGYWKPLRDHGRLVEAHASDRPAWLFECGPRRASAHQSPKRRARARGFALGHSLAAAVASEDATASAASASSSGAARLADAASAIADRPSTAFVIEAGSCGGGFGSGCLQRPLPLARERRD